MCCTAALILEPRAHRLKSTPKATEFSPKKKETLQMHSQAQWSMPLRVGACLFHLVDPHNPAIRQRFGVLEQNNPHKSSARSRSPSIITSEMEKKSCLMSRNRDDLGIVRSSGTIIDGVKRVPK